jgi:Glutamate formiminotransferase
LKKYGIAQISINLTNINITPVHIAFDEVCKKADARGIRVTGSELVGLIPLKAMLDAGKYFLKKQKRSVGVSEKELIRIAVISMGLDELAPFKPEEKIIEYMLQDKNDSRLVSMPLNDFADETASESPAPGGGSIAAYVGSLGVSLARWLLTYHLIKKVGMKDGKSLVTGQRKVSSLKMSCCAWLMQIQKHLMDHECDELAKRN